MATQGHTRPRANYAGLVGFALLTGSLIANAWLYWFVSTAADRGVVIQSTTAAKLWLAVTLPSLLGLPLFGAQFRRRPGGRFVFDTAVGVLITAVCLALAEGGFYLLASVQTAAASPRAGAAAIELSGRPFRPDAQVGYANTPNHHITQTVRGAEGGLLFESFSSTDAYGRRTTPQDHLEKRTRYALFFGGSYTFGYGLNDDETLPAHVARLAPAHHVYNYGVGGYGTQNVLAQFQGGHLPDQIAETDGVALYVYIDNHVRRVVGTSDITWRAQLPYYALGRHDELVRRGTLVSGRPVYAILQGLAEISYTAGYFHVRIPGRVTAEDVALTARLIRAARDSYRSQFGNDNFYVLLYPAWGGKRIIPYLEAHQIRYLDYNDLMSRDAAALWLPDGHPSSRGHAIVARQLSLDLGLTAGE